MTGSTRGFAAAASAAVVLLATACGSEPADGSDAPDQPTTGASAAATPGPEASDATVGAAATWTPRGTVSAATTEFTALVTRVGCNGGVTGEVQEPTIATTPTQVVVTFTVLPPPPAAAGCPGNRPEPYRVRLPEPLGDRELVVGGCDPKTETLVACDWRPEG